MIHTIFEAVSVGNLQLVRKAISCQRVIDDHWSDYKLLVLSLKHNHKEIVKLLLNEGCRVQNTLSKDFVSTPLYYAIKMQDAEILKLLLSKGVSLNSIDHSYESPFELILETCNKQITNMILMAYANEGINPFDNEGFSPLHIACYVGNVNLIEKFLSFGNFVNCCINISARSYAGFSPLHFAVETSTETECVKAVELLLNHGADISVETPDGKSPFYLACDRKIDHPVVDLFTMLHFSKNVFSVKDKGFSLLHSKLLYKHMKHFNISYKIDVSDSSWRTWVPLHFAVAQRKIEMVEFLLNHKADVNPKDNLGITPLHLACQCTYEEFEKITNLNGLVDDWLLNQNQQIKIVKQLLEHNSDVNITDQFGKTPLFHALENFIKIPQFQVNQRTKMNLIAKRKELIHTLLQFGTNLSIADEEGVTVLHDICEYDVIFDESDKIEMAKLVLSRGADVNAKTKFYKTPLFLSIRNKFIDLSKILIGHNADINCICNIHNSFTPLHTLTYYNEYCKKSVGLLNLLLECGADVHAKEVDEATALHIAIDCHGIERDIPDKKDEMALSLLKYGAKVDAQDKNGQTPLHRACLNRYTKGTVVLLNNGADINIQDEFENTPLSYACYRVQEECNTVFFNTLRHHVNKLKFIGFPVSEKNKISLLELEKFYAHRFRIPKIDEFLEQCADEVEIMKGTKIDNYTTLYDVLFKNLNDMASHVKNTLFVEILKSSDFSRQFKIYGFLLKLQYERGLKREKLMIPAEESLRFLSKCELPDLCTETIFVHLSDLNLQAIIDAVNIRSK